MTELVDWKEVARCFCAGKPLTKFVDRGGDIEFSSDGTYGLINKTGYIEHCERFTDTVKEELKKASVLRNYVCPN